MDKRNALSGTIIRKLEIRKESEQLNKSQKIYFALTLCTSAQSYYRIIIDVMTLRHPYTASNNASCSCEIIAPNWALLFRTT